MEISYLTQGYKLLGFHSDAVKVSIILGCSAMSLGNWCLTLQDSLVVCFISKIKNSRDLLTLENKIKSLPQNVRYQSTNATAYIMLL